MAAPSRRNVLPLLALAGLAALSTAAAIAAAVFLSSTGDGGDAAPPPSPATAAAPAPTPAGAEVLRLRERLIENPGDIAGWKALGRAHMERGEYREAVEAFSQASLLAPKDPQIAGALRQLADIARGQGRHKFIP